MPPVMVNVPPPKAIAPLPVVTRSEALEEPPPSNSSVPVSASSVPVLAT